MGSVTNGEASASGTAALTAPSLYPSPSEAALKLQFVGKHLDVAQTPSAVIDAAVVRRNCQLMLDAAAQLKVGFRAHVKTHKTTQIAKLQVGEDSRSIRFICSTVSETENLANWLIQCKAQGKDVNVLHGLPLTPSVVPRLATVARILGEGSVSVFADHPSHIDTIDRIDSEAWPGKIPVWVLIDVGDHREGIAADSTQLADIAKKIKTSTRAKLAGVYTHMGSSYGSSSPQEALKYMSKELGGLRKGALSFLKSAGIEVEDATRGKITISLGASPTATSTQNLLEDSEDAKQYRAQIEEIKKSFEVELHAGVYPVMDMQQIATRARPQHSPNNPGQSLLSWADLGFRIMVEVASLYPERTDKPEALVAAGSIALGREPCKSYAGWAVVTPWPAKSGDHYDPEGSKTGWIVGRISQEHGVLTWEGPRDNMRQLSLGEKLMLWPNHACIAGVNFGWYLVVDSDKADRDEIQDVWVRWRGW